MSLFLLCIDILSRMLAKEKHHLNFKGIKITITNPFIAHLLFANDLVIFCRATKEDALCIKGVLDKFSTWSSQFANKEKFTIHFSNCTHPQTKIQIINTLGFKECNHKFNNLGLAFCHLVSGKGTF